MTPKELDLSNTRVRAFMEQVLSYGDLVQFVKDYYGNLLEGPAGLDKKELLNLLLATTTTDASRATLVRLLYRRFPLRAAAAEYHLKA